MLDYTPEQRMLVADERGYASKRHCQPQESAFVFRFIGLVDHERFNSVCIRKGKQGRSNIRFVVKNEEGSTEGPLIVLSINSPVLLWRIGMNGRFAQQP